MQNLEKTLNKRLGKAERIALVGIGSDIRNDDAAGNIVVRKVKLITPKKCGLVRLKVFFGSTAPENITGEIKKFNPTHIIIVDSAELGKKPGTFKILSDKDIDGVTFSTHKLPTKIMAYYLKRALGCGVMMIGIQPENIEFGKKISTEVKKSASRISIILNRVIRDIGSNRKT